MVKKQFNRNIHGEPIENHTENFLMEIDRTRGVAGSITNFFLPQKSRPTLHKRVKELEMKDKEQVYTLKKTIKQDGLTARVFIPDITKEERAKRMKAVHKAAADLLKAAQV